MKLLPLLPLMAVSCLSFAAADVKEAGFKTPQVAKNTITKQYSNLQHMLTMRPLPDRDRDYPTQIVRLQGKLGDDFAKDCDSVHDEIDGFFNHHVTSENFYYNILTSCVYDEASGNAREFSIDAYFDPVSDEAIDYLEHYLATHNGRDLLGTVFQVESANGLAVSLNVDAGRIANRHDTTLIRYRHDNETHFFPSNYALMQSLISDIYDGFYSNDPEVVLPFMKKWLFSFADKVYAYILPTCNYVELQPERIFFMTKEPQAYTSPLRMYFAHHCDRYDNKRCL